MSKEKEAEIDMDYIRGFNAGVTMGKKAGREAERLRILKLIDTFAKEKDNEPYKHLLNQEIRLLEDLMSKIREKEVLK